MMCVWERRRERRRRKRRNTGDFKLGPRGLETGQAEAKVVTNQLEY